MELILITLATWGIVETAHHGKLFASMRGYMEVKTGFIANIISCPLCLSHWVAALCVLLLHVGKWEFNQMTIPYALLLWIASTRLANLCNDLTHKSCRTPGKAQTDDKEVF